MLRILISMLFLRLLSGTVSSETSYAKVSKNGQLASSHDSLSWITRALMRNNASAENENRSMNDIVITVSPIYMSPRTPKLKRGETFDFPRYSTLDREMIAKLDGRKQIQQRFHPPAIFEHPETANGRPQKGTSNSESSSRVNSSSFLGPIFSGMYEYSPPDFLDDEPMSKPAIISVDKYPPSDKIPDSFDSSPNNYHTGDQMHEMDYSSFAPSYENDRPMKSKPMKFTDHHHHDHPFPFTEDSYEHGHQDHFHHDMIYDHLPEYHEHHHEHTTEMPEMNDQRLDKRPYSYYFIGKKLWYIPLYFSIYFVIYIAALVLKSIARHKINFPAHLAEVASHSKRSEPNEGWGNFAQRILEGVERFAETSGKSS